MARFLDSLGIEMRANKIDVPTPFAGVLIDHGSLVVDESRLASVGDALHEAAHIALATPERRASDFGFLKSVTEAEETTTIAWCWAALVILGLDAEDVFHSAAFRRTELRQIVASARQGRPLGFAQLQIWEMAFDEKDAAAHGVEPFPHMARWLRDAEA